MADLTSTGYQASAASVSFSGTQTLDSLTNNEWTNLSDEIDNSTNKYVMADFYLELGSAAFTGVGSTVIVYLIPSVDGTNYPDWTGNVTTDEQQNEQYFAFSMTTTGATEAQKITKERIAIPPGKWKVGVRNVSGVTLAASANTLYWRPHSFAG